MLNSKAQRDKIIRITGIIRKIETCFFIGVISYGFMALYHYLICNPSNECEVNFINNSTDLLVIRTSLILGAFFSAILIKYNFEIFDEDPRSDKYFKASVFLLAIGYILIAIFLPYISNFGGLGEYQWIYLTIIGIFILATTALLRDKHSWEQSSMFTKLRLTLLIMGYIVFLVNPMLGILGGFLLVIPMLLIPFDPISHKLSIK